MLSSQTIREVTEMANNLNDLLASNAEVNQYFSSLPANVQNAVSGCGEEISTLEDLLRCIKGITGTC